MANQLDHERYCAEITEQTRLFREAVRGADLSAQVPTCPDWNVRELVRHLSGAHHWAAEMVRSRATGPMPFEEAPGFAGPPEGVEQASHDSLDGWLAEGAELLSGALREAGPDAAVWSYFPTHKAVFYARRMTHETAVHRADACRAAGVPYSLAPDVAADAVDEWLELLSGPAAREYKPELAELDARAGDTLHLHATDAARTGQDAEWVIELREGGIGWRRGHEKATVALRGPAASLLLALLRRTSTESAEADLEVLGDEGLLGEWLEKATF